MSSLGLTTVVNTIVGFAYPAFYLCLLIVSVVYLRRFPKPAIYFAIANALLLALSLIRMAAFPVAQQLLAPEYLGWMLAAVSLISMLTHSCAMLLMAVAVFSCRSASSSGSAFVQNARNTVAPSKEALASQLLDDREREDDSRSDDASRYRPPRQPR